ncbi:hypothetical protein [Streptomyces griseochromogenes]|uniref:hypothetical protein n=1 Tax=Streptomyces griseochromogenes TaxID=68214 RepID=UPI003798AED6
MSEWGVALIAAGSAVAGSMVTGWFTRSAGVRQAEAAKHVGDRQADALIATVQATLDDQRNARVHDRRREAYARFVESAHRVELAGSREPVDLTELGHAIVMVRLVGPEPVALAASSYFSHLTQMLAAQADRNQLARLRERFHAAAADALAL